MTNTGSTAAVAIAASRRAERRIIESLKGQGATDSAHAAPLTPRAFSDAAIRRLSRAGAIIAAGEDRWWVNEAAYDQFRSGRRTRALLAVLAVLVVIALIAAVGLAR